MICLYDDVFYSNRATAYSCINDFEAAYKDWEKVVVFCLIYNHICNDIGLKLPESEKEIMAKVFERFLKK